MDQRTKPHHPARVASSHRACETAAPHTLQQDSDTQTLAASEEPLKQLVGRCWWLGARQDAIGLTLEKYHAPWDFEIFSSLLKPELK